jgi:hypothetical protein
VTPCALEGLNPLTHWINKAIFIPPSYIPE